MVVISKHGSDDVTSGTVMLSAMMSWCEFELGTPGDPHGTSGNQVDMKMQWMVLHEWVSI